MTPGEVLADASVADFISELGLGIAAAQTALDDNSLRQIDAFTTPREDLGGRSLLDLGLTPAFYHYQHADISCSMQIRMEVGRDRPSSASSAGRASATDTADADSRHRGDERSSGSSSGTKRARLTMRSDSQGALSIDGRARDAGGIRSGGASGEPSQAVAGGG